MLLSLGGHKEGGNWRQGERAGEEEKRKEGENRGERREREGGMEKRGGERRDKISEVLSFLLSLSYSPLPPSLSSHSRLSEGLAHAP